MHLQEVVARTSHWQLEEVQADAAAQVLQDGEGGQDASGDQVAILDTLARRVSPHVFSEGCKHTLPQYRAPDEWEGLVPTEVPT